MEWLKWAGENWVELALVTIAGATVVRGIIKREKIVLSIGRLFEIGVGDPKRPDTIDEKSDDKEKLSAMQPNFFRFFMDVGGDVETILDNVENFYRGYITACLKDYGYSSQNVIDNVVADVVRCFPELTDKLITSIFRNGLPHSSELSTKTKELLRIKGFVFKEDDTIYAWYIDKFGIVKNTIRKSIEDGWNNPFLDYKTFRDYCEKYECNDITGELIRFYDNCLSKRKTVINEMLLKYRKSDRKELEQEIVKSWEWLHLALGLNRILKKR